MYSKGFRTVSSTVGMISALSGMSTSIGILLTCRLMSVCRLLSTVLVRCLSARVSGVLKESVLSIEV